MREHVDYNMDDLERYPFEADEPNEQANQNDDIHLQISALTISSGKRGSYNNGESRSYQSMEISDI